MYTPNSHTQQQLNIIHIRFSCSPRIICWWNLYRKYRCPCVISLVRTFIYSTPFSVRMGNLIDPQRDKGLDILLLLRAAASWRRENLIDTFEKAEKKEPIAHITRVDHRLSFHYKRNAYYTGSSREALLLCWCRSLFPRVVRSHTRRENIKMGENSSMNCKSCSYLCITHMCVLCLLY